MKFFKHIILGLFAGCTLLLAGCQNDYDAPELEQNKATIAANTTIAEIKALVADNASVKIPYKDEENKVPYIIRGRVVSSDVTGNIFKSLVLQDETAAISLSINEANLYTNYRVGQEVIVNVTDLWGGNYHKLVCIGAGANEYGSLVTSRMAFSVFQSHSQLNGFPDETTVYVPYGEDVPADKPYCLVFDDLSKIPIAGEDYINIQSQLIEVNNVTFELGGKVNYASYKENINRTLKDDYGNTIAVRFSGQSSIFNTPLPAGKGTVRGILSYYGKEANEATNWQILIRDNNDMIFDGKGSKDTPYSVAELFEQNNNGRSAWVSGYIVGSVKGGVTEVTSNNDIIFGKDAEMTNNVVIADSPDCVDYSQCAVVELPSGTKLRQNVNLMQNPDVYKEKLAVLGKFKKFLGLDGVIGSAGRISDYYVGNASSLGTGIESDPYSVDFFIQAQEEMMCIWVEGYVVGYVDGSDFETGARFSNEVPADANYANNNLIIAPSPDVKEITRAMPVRVADRQILGMGNNPSIYGKKVKFKGNTGDYLKWFGMKSTESYVIEE